MSGSSKNSTSSSASSIETTSTCSYTRTTSSIKPVLSSPSSLCLKSFRPPEVPEESIPTESPSPIQENAPQHETTSAYIFPTQGLAHAQRQTSTYVRFYCDKFLKKHHDVIMEIRAESAKNLWVSGWKPRHDSPMHRRNVAAGKVFDLVGDAEGKRKRFRQVFLEDRISAKQREQMRDIELAPDEKLVDCAVVVCARVSECEKGDVSTEGVSSGVTGMGSAARRRSDCEKPRKRIRACQSVGEKRSTQRAKHVDNCAILDSDSDSTEEIKAPGLSGSVSNTTRQVSTRKQRGCRAWGKSCGIM